MTDVAVGRSTAEGRPQQPLHRSVLGAARTQKRWTIEEAAERADLDPQVVEALEEARVYRFDTTQDALAAAVVYAAALGIDVRKARELVGLPVRPRLVAEVLSLRFLATLLLLGALATLGWFAAAPRLESVEPAAAAPAATTLSPEAATALPEPWQIHVAIYNGSARRDAGTLAANRIAGLGYSIAAVAGARRHDYPLTRVYYPPGAEAIGKRLAQQLGISTQALQAGRNPLSLVVIVGARP